MENSCSISGMARFLEIDTKLAATFLSTPITVRAVLFTDTTAKRLPSVPAYTLRRS